MESLSWLAKLEMMVKRFAFNRLPARHLQWLRRRHFARQLRRGTFVFDQAEKQVIDRLLKEGDWVIDLGANVGHYSRAFSQAVGANGRDCGIKVSGLGDHWFVAPAEVPVGVYLDGFGPEDAGPGCGDSLLVECAGLGATVLPAAPALWPLVGADEL